LVAIVESPDRREGRGIYVIRLDSLSPLALQAPHRFYDTKSGLLTRYCFEENDIWIAAWNTVHRDSVDLAHRRDHFFNAMTRALVTLDRSMVVTQIHGFDARKRQPAARSASVVISDTTQQPGPLVRQIASAQKDLVGPDKVRLFPLEVSELGGTLNQQARVFRQAGKPGFLHLEMSRELREELAGNASMRARFFSTLTLGAINWQDRHNR
jgi:hypothetical protein